jgi:SAM-dependent methyltransferase
MDEYTRRTRDWLDGIFAGPVDGPYLPHSPINGFDPHSQYIGTYCHLFSVLSEIARYEFDSCIEVGAGEGFLAEVIRKLFGVPVAAVDLSWWANRRARETFGIANAVAEARELPFKDRCTDLVVSVNTLEHLVDLPDVVAELTRITRGVMVIGMPHARPGSEQAVVNPSEPHAHVSVPSRAEMHRLFGEPARITGSLSPVVRPLYALAARDDVTAKTRYEWMRIGLAGVLYKAARAVGRRCEPRRVVRGLCHLERAAARILSSRTYESIIVRELADVRRRPRPLPAATILATLLR